VFDRWFDSYRRWWCALSGLLLVTSFAPFSCAACGWIALVPAWWVITRSERARRQPFRHGYLVGLIYFGGTFWWISNVTAIGTFFLVLYLALYPAVWFQLVVRFLPRGEGETSARSVLHALGAASLWVVLEWWRSWFLTGFNWNELGISQAPSIVFRQLAAYGGVHLISFVLVTVNVLWAEGVLAMARTLGEKRVVRVSLSFGAALFIVAVGFALGSSRIYGIRMPIAQIHFACIQPNIPQIPYDGGSYVKYAQAESDALEKAEKLSVEAESVTPKPDLLIWPEAFTGQEVFRHRLLNEIVHDIAASSGRYFLLGSQDSDVEGPKVYNCAYLFGPGWDSYQYYRKTRLVILGEFLPFGDTFPILRKWAGVGMDFTPGPGPVRFDMKNPDASFAPLICFEDTLPEVADKAVRLDPEFFITITNDGWYTGWCAAWGVRQHLNHALFRCIEHDRPMIRCANTGISCVISENGTVTSRYRDASGREIDVGGIFTGQLDIHPCRLTLYERWGDWIVLISCLVSGMLGVRFLSCDGSNGFAAKLLCFI
jgi:apolipoprotein N-acyltransferase